MNDRKALSACLSGVLLFIAAGACWWSGGDILLHRLLRLADPAWSRPVKFLSALGGFAVMGPVALAAFALLLWRGRRGDALWLFLAIAAGRLMVEGIKLVVERPRPPATDWLEAVKSWSFPSSHSAGTMMTCLALSLLFGRNGWAFAAAFLMAAAIGWSRIALGVHWPSDVLAGWGFGLLWIGLALGVRNAAGPAS